MEYMKKQCVSYRQSVLLKELGFDEPCLFWYTNRGKKFEKWSHPTEGCSNSRIPDDGVAVPSHQQVMTWFRERAYYIAILPIRVVSFHKDESYTVKYTWYLLNEDDNKSYDTDTYEDAVSNCIDHMCSIMKRNNESIIPVKYGGKVYMTRKVYDIVIGEHKLHDVLYDKMDDYVGKKAEEIGKNISDYFSLDTIYWSTDEQIYKWCSGYINPFEKRMQELLLSIK
jgi:hypothetical protein